MIGLSQTRRCGQPDHRSDRVPAAAGTGEQQIEPVLPGLGHVVKQFRRLVQARHNYVHTSVIVEIAESASTMRARRRLNAPSHEGPIPPVHINLIWLPKLAAAEQLGVVHHVRGRGKQILPAIVVQVVDASARRTEGIGRPAGYCTRRLKGVYCYKVAVVSR